MLTFLEKAYKREVGTTLKELPSHQCPADWINRFAALIYTNYPLDPKPECKEIEHRLHDKVKSMNSFQKGNLQTVYAIISQRIHSPLLQYTPEQNSSISAKLYEGMIYCPSGFNNRVNELLQGMLVSTSLEEMMQLMREEITFQTACQLTDEVHARNRVSLMAKDSYGIRPINADDEYRGALKDEFIRQRLRDAFEQKYTPILMLRHLEAQIRGALQLRGYIGELGDDNSSYKYKECHVWTQYLNQLLGTQYQVGERPFLTQLVRNNRKNRLADNEGQDDPELDYSADNIVDIDWIMIRKDLINKLYEKKLINHAANQILHDMTQLNITEQDYVFQHLHTEQQQYNLIEDYCLKKQYTQAIVCLKASNSKALFDLFFSRINLDELSIKNNIDLFIWACQNGHTAIVALYLDAAKNNPDLLKEILLAGIPGQGPAHGFKLACHYGHTAIVASYLDATKDNPDLLKEILLAGIPGHGSAHGFRWACQYGHTAIVALYLDAAKNNPDLLKEILLAGTPGNDPAHGFKLACRYGHTAIVASYLDAAKDNPDLLKEILLAGIPGHSSAHGFRWACQYGHTAIVASYLDAAKNNPNLLKEILLASASGNDSADGFRWACQKGYNEVSVLCLEHSNDTSFKQLMDICTTENYKKPFQYLIKNPERLFTLLQRLNTTQKEAVFKKLKKLDFSSQEEKNTFNKAFIDLTQGQYAEMASQEIINIYNQHASFFSLTRFKIFLGFYNTALELIEELQKKAQKNPFGASTQTCLTLKQNLLHIKTESLPEIKTLSYDCEIPDALCCPISLDLLRNPVCWPSNGHDYFFEQEQIDALIKKARDNNLVQLAHPITRINITMDDLIKILQNPSNIEKSNHKYRACLQFTKEHATTPDCPSVHQ